jgi:hypothetical protein
MCDEKRPGPSRFFSGRQSAYRDSFVAGTLSREMRGAVSCIAAEVLLMSYT